MMERVLRRAVRCLGVLSLALVLPACGGRNGNHLEASGTVEATDARLGFGAPGRVESVAVREGDVVKPGDALAALRRTEAQARRDQAAAQLAAAQARLAELARGFRGEEVAQARAEDDAAAKRLADAERELARADRLFAGGAISREAHDKAVLARDVAKAQRDKAAEQLQLMQRGYRAEQVEAARAQVAQAEATLAAADAVLDDMTIEAPFGGVVTLRHREPGESVTAGAPVLTLMDPEDRWVRIYVREDRVGAVPLGAPATIKSDTFPDKTYAGEVVFVASEAEFTPKNVQTSEERVRLVFAVKVRITDDPAHELKPGMPADVTLDLGGAGAGSGGANAAEAAS